MYSLNLEGKSCKMIKIVLQRSVKMLQRLVKFYKAP